MDDQQSTFKVVDRRPFNPDGTPRELSPQEKEETDRIAESLKIPASETPKPPSPPAPSRKQATQREAAEAAPVPAAPPAERPTAAGYDQLDDPASFLSLIMSLASNAASSLGMMPHPVTGETGVDLKLAKLWIDVLGLLVQKTRGNLDDQEAQMVEHLLADLRMQYVSFSSSPTPPAKFSASDITGGK